MVGESDVAGEPVPARHVSVLAVRVARIVRSVLSIEFGMTVGLCQRSLRAPQHRRRRARLWRWAPTKNAGRHWQWVRDRFHSLERDSPPRPNVSGPEVRCRWKPPPAVGGTDSGTGPAYPCAVDGTRNSYCHNCHTSTCTPPGIG